MSVLLLFGRPPTQTVQPLAIPSAEAVSTVTALPGVVTVIPTGVDSAEAFGNQAIAPGPVSTSIVGIPSAEAVDPVVVVPGAVTAIPTGIPSAEAVSPVTALPGPVSVAPTGIPTAEAVDPVTIYSYMPVTMVGIPSAEAVNPVTAIPGSVAIIPDGISPPKPKEDTQGDWVGVRGTDGYVLFGWNVPQGDGHPWTNVDDLVSLPAGITYGVDQGNVYSWNDNVAVGDVRATESPDETIRKANTLYTPADTMQFHINFAGAYSGMLWIYCLDWDSGGVRDMTVTITDGTRSRVTRLAPYSHGVWLGFSVNFGGGGGTVTVSVLSNMSNGTIAGFFLGEASSVVSPVTVLPGPVSVSFFGIPTAEAFGNAFVRALINVTPTGIPSAEAVNAVVIVVGATHVSPTGIPSAETFGIMVIVPPGAIYAEFGTVLQELVLMLVPQIEILGQPFYNGGIKVFGSGGLELTSQLKDGGLVVLTVFDLIDSGVLVDA